MIGLVRLCIHAAKNAAADNGDNNIESHKKEDTRKQKLLAKLHLGVPHYEDRETDDLVARESAGKKK